MTAEADLAAIIVAAGRSERMGPSDKLWAPLETADGRSRPLLAHTIAAFQVCPIVHQVTLVVAQDAVERAGALAREEGFAKVCAIVPGGAHRRDSVRAGLETLKAFEWVCVHDGARPLVTPELIASGLEEARETGASCCAVPAHDTVKEVSESYVERTLDRSRVWLAQTPQTFRRELLLAAHEQQREHATDDAALVEASGVRVRVYPGSRRNVKVTTPEDLALVEALLRS